MNQSTLSGADGIEWLSLSQAAARLGVSEKTLRRRIHAGEIEGEKTAMEGGGLAWRVRLDGGARDKCSQSTLNVPEAVPEPSGARAGIVPELIHSQTARDGSAMDKRAGTVPEVVPELSDSVPEPKTDSGQSTLTAHLLEENKFLRGALEARDRDAAELRAALREALKLSNRALPEAQSTLASSSNDGGQSRDVAPQSAQSTLATANTLEPVSDPQIERKAMAARRTFRRWLLEILRG
jgi:excisionase family DNA binding protein